MTRKATGILEDATLKGDPFHQAIVVAIAGVSVGSLLRPTEKPDDVEIAAIEGARVAVAGGGEAISG